MNSITLTLQPTEAPAAEAYVAELFLYRTHTAAARHARHYTTAPYQPMCIVDTQNDEALACGSIVEELHRRLPRQCGHRVFSIEVKRAAIARVLEDGRDVREVAAALELSHASLQRWVAQALASQPTMVTEPAAWLQLPHPLDCHGPGDPEPIQPPPPPEEAPPPPEQAPPPQEFPPVSVPEAEPPSPPEQAPLPQEFPLGGMRLANRRGDIADAFVAATKWPTQR